MTTVILLAVLVFLALLSITIYRRYDLTVTKKYSLSEQTVNALDNLDRKISAVGFYTPSHHERENTVSLLKRFSDASEQFAFEIVNPEKNPGRTRRYGKIADGTVVVEAGSLWEKIKKPDETSILSAVLRISSEKEKRVYFIQGHGEKGPEDRGSSGLKRAGDVLGSLGYDLFSLNLLKTGTIPKVAGAVVLAGPKKDLFQEELAKLDLYLKDGGALVVLADPNILPNLARFCRSLGVALGSGVIIDKSNRLSGSDLVVTLIDQYSTHEITEEIESVTIFPLSRSVEPLGINNRDILISPLARTGADAWLETDLPGLFRQGVAEFDGLNDVRGPVTVAVAGEIQSSGARFVVFGDSDFASNTYFDQGANGDVFVNSILWLNREKELIASRPFDQEFYPIVLTKSQLRLLFWISVVLLPAAALSVGVYVVRRVRWRG